MQVGINPWRNDAELKPLAAGKNHPLVRTVIADYNREHGSQQPHPDLRLERHHLAVWFYDLNRDGSPEGLVNIQGPYLCGTVGCETKVYSQIRGEWRLIAVVWGEKPYITADDDRAYDGVVGFFDIDRWSTQRGKYVHSCISVSYTHLRAHET